MSHFCLFVYKLHVYMKVTGGWHLNFWLAFFKQLGIFSGHWFFQFSSLTLKPFSLVTLTQSCQTDTSQYHLQLHLQLHHQCHLHLHHQYHIHSHHQYHLHLHHHTKYMVIYKDLYMTINNKIQVRPVHVVNGNVN